MARYPISHSMEKNLGEFFHYILVFHIPPARDEKLLDPTRGKKDMHASIQKEAQ